MDKWSGFEAERYRPMQIDEDPQAPAPRSGVDEGPPVPADSFSDGELMDFASLREIVQDADLQGCDLLDDDVLGWDPMEDDPLADGLPDDDPGIGLWDDDLFGGGPQDGGAAEAGPPHEETVRGKGPSGPGAPGTGGRGAWAGWKQDGRAAFSSFGPPEGRSGGRSRDSSIPRADTGGSTPEPARHGVWAAAILEAAAAAADPDSGRGEDTPDWEVRRLVKNLRRFRRSVRLVRRTARAVHRGAAAGGGQAAAAGGAQAARSGAHVVRRAAAALGKAAGVAVGRGAAGIIAAVLLVLIVLNVVLVVVVSHLEDKYPPEVLENARQYIGGLDTALEQRILAEADPNIQTHYYVNGKRIGTLRIQTDADELLLYLDDAYNTIDLSEPVVGDMVMLEINAIHALLYSYTAETMVDCDDPHLSHIRVIRVTIRSLTEVLRDAAQAEIGGGS